MDRRRDDMGLIRQKFVAINLWTILYVLMALNPVAEAIYCTQCTSVDSGINTTDCFTGLRTPTLCTNVNHTHCAIYHIRTATYKKTVLIWRKCAASYDVPQTCAVINTRKYLEEESSKMNTAFKQLPNFTEFERSLEVFDLNLQLEICVHGCDTDGCTAGGADSPSIFVGLTLGFVIFGVLLAGNV